MRAKIWSKYAKDVLTYVDRRTNLELEWARNLTKLAQNMRPVLKEESYLPFQSLYCIALDQVRNNLKNTSRYDQEQVKPGFTNYRRDI